MTSPICDYCGLDADLVDGKIIYPHRKDLASKWFWRCDPCGAHVGCHPGGCKPLGRLANAELRRAKSAVHRVFDPMWKSGKMTRTAAYQWLSHEIGIPAEQCHIGMFDVMLCQRAIHAMEKRRLGEPCSP